MNLHSENINEISAALAKVQGDIKAAQKDGANPHFKSRFASLNSHWDVCREVLSKNGLTVTQLPSLTEDGRNMLVTMLCHSSGQWFKSCMILKPVKDDPQGMGSCLTYARRYMLSAIVGTTSDDEDDDGEGASGRTNGKSKTAPTKSNEPMITPSEAHELMRLRLSLKEDQKTALDGWIKKTYDVEELAFLPISAYEKVSLILNKKVNNESN